LRGGKYMLGRLRRWQDNIQMDLAEIKHSGFRTPTFVR